MYQKYFKWFLTSLRAVLMLLALSALLVVGIWTYEEEAVNQFGKDLAEEYTSHYRFRLDGGMALADAGDISGLTTLLSDIDSVKKQGRLDPIKRAALSKVVSTLSASKKYAEAMVWNETWLAFDDRDIAARLSHAQLLIASEEHYEEGMNKLAALQHKVPAVAAVSDAYIKQLANEKRFYDAFMVVDSISELYLGRTTDWMDKPWDVFWDTGNSFNALQRTLVTPRVNDKGELELEFDLEASVQGIRIDPPARTELTIANLHIAQAKGKEGEGYSIPAASLKLNQIERSSTALVSAGGTDPYFIWKQPATMIVAKKQRWVFRANVTKPLPEALSPLFTPLAAEQIVATLEQQGNDASLQRYLHFNKLESAAESAAVSSTSQDADAQNGSSTGWVATPTPNGGNVIATVDSLLAAQKYTEAYLLVDKKVGRYFSPAGTLDKRNWTIYWDTGNGFNGKQKAKIAPVESSGGRMVLKFDLEAKVGRIRIDPPPSLELSIFNPEMSTTKNDKVVIRSMTEAPLELHQIEQSGAALRTYVTNDPYFVYKVPGAMRLNHTEQWHFIADVDQIWPTNLQALFTPAAVAKIKKQLEWSGNRAALDRYTALYQKHGGQQ